MRAVQQQNEAKASTVKTRIPIQSFAALAFDEIKVIVKGELPSASVRTRVRTILVVSEDAALGDALCLVAAKNALSVVQTPSLLEAVEQTNRVQPAAILLDLDLSSDGGWQAAEWFLGHRPSVPILMLTGRTAHHELGAAIRSGVVFEKSTGSARLLHAAVAMLEESAQQGQGQIALQQAWLRRAKPYRWEAVAMPGYRHWGINE